MRKAGGIIALVAGIFGVFAAGFTLFFGGGYEQDSCGNAR